MVPRWPGDRGPSRPLGPMHSVLFPPLATPLSAEDQRLLLHRCLFSPVHRIITFVVLTRDANTQLLYLQRNRCFSLPSCEKNSFCFAFLLIPMLGKSGSTLYLIKFQTASVRTVFCSPQIHLQTRHNLTWDFQKDWNWKTMLCRLHWIWQ